MNLYWMSMVTSYKRKRQSRTPLRLELEPFSLPIGESYRNTERTDEEKNNDNENKCSDRKRR